jgi:hypothetical protein
MIMATSGRLQRYVFERLVLKSRLALGGISKFNVMKGEAVPTIDWHLADDPGLGYWHLRYSSVFHSGEKLSGE